MLALYRVFAFLLTRAVLIWWLLKAETRARVRERLGLVPPGAAGALWFHAASVGEFRALKALIQREWGRPVVVTVQSPQGYALARRELAVHVPVFAAPLDTAGAISKFLDRLQPAALVLVESELWPGWMDALGRRGTPAVLLDGSLSARSSAQWSRWDGLANPIRSALKTVTVSSDAQLRRFEALGFGSVTTALPLKLASDPLAVDSTLADRWLEWRDDRALLVLANVHPSEIAALQSVLDEQGEGCQIIIAPRHPDKVERFEAAFGEASDRLTYWTSFGTLGTLFELGGTVVMGGGFDPAIGSHNPLEALSAGCVTITGPHDGKQAALIDLLVSKSALRRWPAWSEEVAGLSLIEDLVAQAKAQAVEAIEAVL